MVVDAAQAEGLAVTLSDGDVAFAAELPTMRAAASPEEEPEAQEPEDGIDAELDGMETDNDPAEESTV